MEIFLIIAMKTKTNKNLYLSENGTNGKLEWSFNINDAIWFNTDQDANKFADKYFKNFHDWFITDTTLDINTV